MKRKKIITSITFFLIGLIGLYAQEAVPASGGDATGAGGTSSYSVGQVVYTTVLGSNGSVAQGVQQPFEISVVTGLEVTKISLELTAFPNPTTNNLTLKVDENELSNIHFQLYDLQGKLLESGQLSNSSVKIQMENLPSSTYLLKVFDENTELKTFKILKR